MKVYESPEIEIIKFDVEDVMTTSCDLNENELPIG